MKKKIVWSFKKTSQLWKMYQLVDIHQKWKFCKQETTILTSRSQMAKICKKDLNGSESHDSEDWIKKDKKSIGYFIWNKKAVNFSILASTCQWCCCINSFNT